MDCEQAQVIGSIPAATAAQLSYHIQDKDVHLSAAEKALIDKLLQSSDDGTSETITTVDLTGYAKLTDLPKKITDLENDAHFITASTDQITRIEFTAQLKELSDRITALENKLKA